MAEVKNQIYHEILLEASVCKHVHLTNDKIHIAHFI